MQARQIALLTAVAVGLLNVSPGPAPHLHAQEQLPVTYICTMDPDVIDDKPGTCPVCKMTLQPVRIESGWSCPNHAVIVRTEPGRCPIDKRELLPVFINHFWDCGEIVAQTPIMYADPGTCTDGKPRVEKRMVRAHGDHNPRHGGQFFMATDKWHHVEGTYPSQNLVRVYLYDNFTQPLDLKGISGRAFTREENNRELDPVPLKPSRDGKTLEAQVKGAALPQKVSIRLSFKPETPEDKFDFTFTELSKEPAPQAPTTTAAARPAAVPPRTAAAITKPSTTTTASATPAATGSPAPSAVMPSPAPTAAAETPTPQQQAVIGAVPDVAAAAMTLTRAGATSLAQDLPNNTADLIKLLELRGQEVQTLIQEGNFGLVYVPTMLAKDVALALQDHISELPARQHTPLTSAVRRLILSAWRLDQYGDLGDREKITQAHSVFAAAAADIRAAYASR